MKCKSKTFDTTEERDAFVGDLRKRNNRYTYPVVSITPCREFGTDKPMVAWVVGSVS